MSSLGLLEAKNKEKVKFCCCFPLTRSKINFPILGASSKNQILYFLYLIFEFDSKAVSSLLLAELVKLAELMELTELAEMCPTMRFSRDGHAFLNAFVSHVPLFLDFSLVFPLSYILFF